jgi:hypothetical protein
VYIKFYSYDKNFKSKELYESEIQFLNNYTTLLNLHFLRTKCFCGTANGSIVLRFKKKKKYNSKYQSFNILVAVIILYNMRIKVFVR